MALSTVALVAAIAPEYSADTRLDAMLEIAATSMSASAWGAVYTQAVVYLAAHLMKAADGDGTAGAGTGAGSSGPVTSRSAGDLSVSYGSSSSGVSSVTTGDAALMTTAYGREFLRLRGSRAARAPMVIDNGT